MLSIAEPLSLLKKEDMLTNEPMVEVTCFVNFMQRFFFEQLRIQAKIDPDQYAPLLYKDAKVVTAEYLQTENDDK